MNQHPTQVAVWVAVQNAPVRANEGERPAKRGFHPLLDPLEQAVAWVVHRLVTPERGQRYAAWLGLPGARHQP